ncbi:hypothetical protein NDU88_009991 [Pleurodeles waltl]|uniref:Uncharacterized protein n=1 Tax=Pleurodeles waltl TaxID=8319 RepID=A0AAV7PU16_PLEWA|nr:hypothetical protein NDU88_009991 [Pleurodeles waltl]
METRSTGTSLQNSSRTMNKKSFTKQQSSLQACLQFVISSRPSEMHLFSQGLLQDIPDLLGQHTNPHSHPDNGDLLLGQYQGQL